jgi:hypothetical protein
LIPTVLHVRTNTHCLAEKQWVFGVLGKWWHIEFILHGGHETGYTILLPNAKEVHLADLFFDKVVQPGVYVKENLPKAANKIQLGGALSDLPWYTLYGSGTLTVAETVVQLDADLVGTAFFLLSRWEEYAHPAADAHGRLLAEAHLLHLFGLSHVPILDDWSALFSYLLEQAGYCWTAPSCQPKFEISCDVDIPLLWNGNMGRWKTILGALLKRRDIEEARYWLLQNYKQEQPSDPCDTYTYLMDLAENTGGLCTFHFLGERPPHFDHYYSLQGQALVKIKRNLLERGHQIGFHPSMQAVQNQDRFSAELASIRKFADLPIHRVRTHYLTGLGPETWRLMEQHQLKIDSSLGYFDATGFRCGTACSYQLFDWQERKPLDIVEQPLVAMDVGLVLAQKLSPAEALASLQNLQQALKDTNGTFTLLWHNSSFYTWPWYHYRKIPAQLIQNHA